MESAKTGDSDSQCKVGKLYEYGHGVVKSYKYAMYWYIKAASKGDTLAQCNIGDLYRNGNGVKRCYEKFTEF